MRSAISAQETDFVERESSLNDRSRESFSTDRIADGKGFGRNVCIFCLLCWYLRAEY